MEVLARGALGVRGLLGCWLGCWLGEVVIQCLIDGLAATQVGTGVLLQAQGGFVLFGVLDLGASCFSCPRLFFLA